ncbi:MAG: hypothetical protein BKP49_08990 [Treponema sp. CETP13]|nr:MAG: hypothetical protein BKP49_08990 [Treponema sp. CETP13]
MKETEDDLDFHYKREERLEKAPPIVKNWYDGSFPTPPKGFFESFVHTKLSRMLLITLGIIFACCVVTIVFFNQNKKASLSGVPITLSAFSFEDTVYVSIKASEISEIAYKKISDNKNENEIHILIKYYGEEESLISEQTIIGFYSGKEAFYRTTTTNYDIIKVEIELTGLQSNVKLFSEVQQK